jgi:hypothetical protein
MNDRGTRLPGALAGLLAGLLVMAVAACGSGSAPSTTPAPPARFDESGLTFDYPASWRVFHYENVSSFTSILAYLATVEVHDPCVRTPGSVSCGAGYALEPGTLVVTIEAASFPGFNILDVPPGARPITVDGLPGYVEDGDPIADPGATAVRTWSIARPGSIDNYVRITANVRTPNEGAMLDLVDRTVKGIRYNPPVVPLPTGPGAALEAATTALKVMAAIEPGAWACFPPSGERTTTVTTLPMGPALATPGEATCTTSIEATPLQMWRMTLEMRLSKQDPNAGMGTRIVMFVGADGQPGMTTGETLDP